MMALARDEKEPGVDDCVYSFFVVCARWAVGPIDGRLTSKRNGELGAGERNGLKATGRSETILVPEIF